MNLRSQAITAMLACAVILLIIGQRQISKQHRLDTNRMHEGAQLGAGVSEAQASVLRKDAHRLEEALVASHPQDGAIYPDSFPSPRITWKRLSDGLVYLVELRRGTESVVALTHDYELRLDDERWEKLKNAEGPMEVRIRAGRVEADGRLIGEVLEGPSTHFNLTPPEDRPTGMMVYGTKHRPPELPSGTVSVMFMNLALLGMDLETFEPRLLFRSAYGPEPQLGEGRGHGGPGGGVDYNAQQGPGNGPHDGPGDRGPHDGPEDRGPHDGPGDRGPHDGPQGGGPDDGPHDGGPGGEGQGVQSSHNCVSCHDVSSDGRYVAVFSQNEDEAPSSFDAPNGFLTVLSMPGRKVVAQLPHAFMPQFHPERTELLAFSQVGETIGAKDQMQVHQGDIHILNLSTGEHQALPGADLVDRVESIPMWSPTGEKLALIRAPKNQVWHGSQTKLDIAVVPFNNGAGGEAVDLSGASGNDRSNFYPDFSPDGRWLVFAQADRGFFSQMSGDLWIVPAEGGEARRLDCSSDHAESWHRFSPDGKWLAFVTNREDIRLPDIWMSRFDSETGQCAPAIQIPQISGPDAHVHAFDWSVRFPWLDDGADVEALDPSPEALAASGSSRGEGGRGDHSDRNEGGGPDDRDGEGGGPAMGTPMEAPPEVEAQAKALMSAIARGKPEAVKSLFISRELFLEVSDCQPDTVVNDVLSGRDEIADLANRELSDDPNRAADVSDLRLFEGRMLQVNKGEKPERCRARRDVRLFQTSWSWSLDGNQESGEAHLLEIDGHWYFAKF